MIIDSMPSVRLGREPTAHALGEANLLRLIKRYLPLAVLIATIAIVFRGWLASGAIHYGDWIYNPSSRLNDYWPIPSLWDGAFGTGGTSILSGPMLPVLFLESALNQLHVDPGLSMRFLWIFPGVLICALSTYALAISFFGSKWAGVISGLFAVTNSYIANIATGGQFTVAMGFWLEPLVLWLFYRAMQRYTPSRVILVALTIVVQIMYDLRSVYLTLGVVILFVIHYALAQNSWRLVIRVATQAMGLFVAMGVVSVLVHAFWLLPGHFSDKIALPAGYDSSDWVYRLSYMRLSHGFALFHPFWYQDTPLPQPAPVSPAYFLLALPIFAVFLRRRVTFVELFLFSTAVLAIFFVKGDNPPFGNIYGWFFHRFPGFNMYRDPSKFYQPLGLAYALLLGRAATVLFTERKGRRRTIPGAFAARALVPIVCVVVLLLQLLPLAANTSWGTLATQPVPAEYLKLDQYIDRQPGFFRIVWYSGLTDFGSYSNRHPSISVNEIASLSSWRRSPQLMARLKALSVKYIVVGDAPNDTRQNKADETAAIRILQRILPSVSNKRFGNIHVFVNRLYLPIVSIPNNQVTPSMAHALLRRSTLPPTTTTDTQRVGKLGEYSSTCGTCLTLMSMAKTRYEVVVHDVKHPYLLVLNQAFDPNWDVYIEPGTMPQSFWWTWTHKKAIASHDHTTVNGFANAWLITTPGTYRIVIEYWPQRITDVGWIVCWLTILTCLSIAIVPPVVMWRRNSRRTALTVGVGQSAVFSNDRTLPESLVDRRGAR